MLLARVFHVQNEAAMLVAYYACMLLLLKYARAYAPRTYAQKG